MATMVPRPRRRRTQQSANMVRDKSMSLKLEDIIVLLFISSVKARRLVDASCLFLPVAVAASGHIWPAKSCCNSSLYLWLSFRHGRTRKDSAGRPLSLAAEAMLGVFFEGVLMVIYRSLYVGLSVVGHNFQEAIFLTSTSKSRVITTSTILRQPILHYEDTVRNPQTLVSLESWRSQLS